RLRVTPEKRGSTLMTDELKTLAQMATPVVPDLKPSQATLQREGEHDLTARLTIRYAVDPSAPPALHRLALPFLAASGVPGIEGVEDPAGGHLALVWEDAQTRHCLRLPYEAGQPVQFEAGDRQGTENLAEREAAVAAFDRAERKSRIESGKALTRLPR